jgi:hypothetical protein
MPGWIVGFGEIGVDILHGGLELVQGVPELHEAAPRHQDVVGFEAVRRGQVPGLEGALAMTAPAVDLGPAGAVWSPESGPAPETPANGG